MRKQIRFLGVTLLLLAFILSACGPAVVTDEPVVTDVPVQESATNTPEPTATLEPVTVKIAILPYASYLPLYIAEVEGYLAAQGITAEFVPFTNTPDMTTALAQGQIDVGAGPVNVSSLNTIAQGGGILFVADKGYLDPVGCSTSAWVVQQDLLSSGGLDDLTNLAGMKAAFTVATVNEYAFDVFVEPYGLSSADLEVLSVPAPTRLEALNNGSVDLVYLAEPWVTRAMASGHAGILKTWESYMPEFQLSVLWYGPTLTQQNPEVGRRFMVAYLQAVRQYNEGKTDRNVELMVEFTQGSEEEVRQTCWQTMRDDGSINLPSILDLQQWALDKGYLVRILSEDELWDSQFIDYANEALR